MLCNGQDMWRWFRIGVVITRDGAGEYDENVTTWKMVAVQDDSGD